MGFCPSDSLREHTGYLFGLSKWEDYKASSTLCALYTVSNLAIGSLESFLSFFEEAQQSSE
jgi:hypothetical protein